MGTVVAGLLWPWALCAALLGLHLALPARRVAGYVRDPATGEPLRYRLNGLLVLAVAVAAWAGAGAAGLAPWDWLWTIRWPALAGACAMGLAFTAWIVLPAPPTGKPLLADLFLGRLENPRLLGGRVDAKMFLYLFGAVLLALNLLAFAARHVTLYGWGGASPGVLVHTALFAWFVVDYLVFEKVHLWTYDLFAERVGFKLGWGCLTFYPFFYAVGLWGVAERPDPGHGAPYYVVAAVVFFAGWSLARGANLQKFAFKTAPERAFLGVFAPRTVDDGARRLLVSGFWGVSRHVNYLGEILMATGLALALGWPGVVWPWLYPLYYV
ncbi:MAG: DUF1295 domain-containing protein, partial [Myxococcales bacterium]|nr:DUF1295 domain-containing protein [Myxococcales bacterium]